MPNKVLARRGLELEKQSKAGHAFAVKYVGVDPRREEFWTETIPECLMKWINYLRPANIFPEDMVFLTLTYVNAKSDRRDRRRFCVAIDFDEFMESCGHLLGSKVEELSECRRQWIVNNHQPLI